MFFFNDPATTEIYTLSLHDALPICGDKGRSGGESLNRTLGQFYPAASPIHTLDPRAKITATALFVVGLFLVSSIAGLDRKSTRLNSSHANISYAVFCLKKKNILRVT